MHIVVSKLLCIWCLRESNAAFLALVLASAICLPVSIGKGPLQDNGAEARVGYRHRPLSIPTTFSRAFVLFVVDFLSTPTRLE